MAGLRRGRMLVEVLLALVLGVVAGGGAALAQVAGTVVQDTVYRADGTPAGGSVVVSWGSFTTAGGSAVAAGTTTATIGAGGVLTMTLAPNAGSTPMGSYYTAVFHLNDGTTSREYWVVPVAVPGGAPVKLAAIENTVLPTSVAMQTVSKAYVDAAVAKAVTGYPLDSSPYVEKAGDTMTGPLGLPGDPVTPTQAADKNYVDENIAAVAGGVGGKVSLLPGSTQVVSQPAGTQLEVNDLNGELYATQYLTGTGSDGLTNALGSADCAQGCELKAEQTYPGTETLMVAAVPDEGHVVDARGGEEAETFVNPLPPGTFGASAGRALSLVSTRAASTLAGLEPGATASIYTMTLHNTAEAGGSNQFPGNFEVNVPYFKSTYGAIQTVGNYYTPGQHVQESNEINCYSVGDCLAGSQFITTSGGFRDVADEGTHPFDLSVAEDSGTFAGTCAAGCATGATTVTVTATSGAGKEGEGRFLIDKAPGKVISTGTLIGGARTIYGVANFTGTNFPVSVFLATAQAATSQPTNVSPGTVTLPIATSGVTAGFATNTAALPAASGVACVVNPIDSSDQEFPGYEMANYSVVDGTHIQLTLNYVHGVGATIAVGGLCGYGVEQTVDTVGALRQVFPVVGSSSATSLYYADGATPVLGLQGSGSTGAFLNVSLTVASIARTGNVVTVTTAGNLPADVNGLTLTVAGVTDSSYNGSYVVTTTGPNTLTYANTGANSTSTGGTLSVVTGGFALYPMAEVRSVYDAATKTVDGVLTLAPNTVAWAAGDALEEPHYYQQRTIPDTEFITQFLPRPIQQQNPGKQYLGVMGPGMRGWTISNQEAATDYLGNGGTHSAPDDAYSVTGVWGNDFEVQAGERALLRSHCNSHGCNRWDSSYNLFELDAAVGEDVLQYQPQASTATWNLGGALYSFSPAAFTANTINVGTLNATTITGGVSGTAISSGTVNAARLPLFGPSGTTHAPGIVPDPGGTAGATRFLREDGTWNVPSGSGGGGGSPTGTAGGDLSGSYPNPLVTGVHATSGSVTGLTSAAAAQFALSSTGGQYVAFNEDNVKCKFCDYASGTAQWGQGQRYFQMYFVANAASGGGESIGYLFGRNPTATNASDTDWQMWANALLGKAAGSTLGWSNSASYAGTTGSGPAQNAGFSNPATGAVSCDTGTAGNAACAFSAGKVTAATVAVSGGTIDGTVIGGTTRAAGSFTTVAASGAVTWANGGVSAGGTLTAAAVIGGAYLTNANTYSTASPAVEGSSAAGMVQVAAGATTLTVNTNRVTAASRILLTYSLSNNAGGVVTAPTNMGSLLLPYVSAIAAGTSFTLTLPVAPAGNAVNVSFLVVN